jgi:hypothetical protein
MLKEMRKAIKSMPTRTSSGYTSSNTMKTTTPSMIQKTSMPMPKKNAPIGNTFRNLVKAPAKKIVTGAKPVKKLVGQAPAMSYKKKGYKPSSGVGVGM